MTRLPDAAARGLGRLLGLANARAGGSATSREFYDLKDRVLRRWGAPAGEDVQRIVKACWGYPDEDGCRGRSCGRCGGTGVWDKKLVRLERWELGGRIFHRPAATVHGAEWEARVTIEGLIRHDDVSPRASAEAALWLALLFDPPLFWRRLSRSRAVGARWRRYPMLALQAVVFEARTRLLAVLPTRRECWDCGRRFVAVSGRRRCRACARDLALTYPEAVFDDDLPF